MTHSHDHDHHGHASHAADHGHDHGPVGHAHVPQDFGKAFALGIALNAAFVVIEVSYGVLAHSVALIADAGHNLSDALGLAVAWAAVVLARRKPTSRFTYGLGGTSILAALFNAIFLLVVTGGLTWEAIRRFTEPQPAAGGTVMIVAACGIVLNGFCAWLFASGRKGDLNVRGAYLHMAADALVSLGVVGGGLIILVTGWAWVDPLMTLVISIVIVRGTWSLLTGAVSMSLGAVPPNVDLMRLRAFLHELPGVADVHDLHVWSLSTTETAMTCHLVLPDGHPGDAFIERVADEIRNRFEIGHATLQIEKAPSPEHIDRAC
ncbi:cation diffusion facilitator family transporter [Rhizobium calliandrae]|uniref:Cation diffusion facilitator family transporter n=1 Tax=Rhizobium calliandrae TaxID=1312182 RepID=A0ABT7KMK3_9HYPH|nr:cation diffusion facilitator family transporter [Rhizobium calliandrae]MDL2409807.1 cation diffusion facilitator family transporter [Rhizobium calliandrae]